LNRQFKIVAHAHRELFQLKLPRQLIEQRKMGRRQLINRRDAHQAVDRQSRLFAAKR
jgi:hypothetical protein